MTQDTEDVVARLKRVASPGYVRHTAGNTFSTNTVYVNPDGPAAIKLIQSLSDRIDVLEGSPTEAMLEAGLKVLRASGMVEEALESDALTIAEIYEAMTRAALHQEGFAKPLTNET